LFLNGLSCGDGTQTSFIDDLKASLGDGIRIHRPDLKWMDRSSTGSALRCITREFSHLQKPLVIGHSLGGLWAIYLAAMGFTDEIIAISPALPANFNQYDSLRLSLFWKSLLLGQSFQFTEKDARIHLMQNAPDELIRECAKHFRPEPSSLIREYGLMPRYLKLSESDLYHLNLNVNGLIISGESDEICPIQKQKVLADQTGFRHELLPCGHSPQYGEARHEVLRLVHDFIEKNLLQTTASA
jgi:pimeloyl-ACP methyl ester carboxylesterase